MNRSRLPDFDSIRQTNVYGVEYWSARDLMPLLGYDYWQNFQHVIKKAMKSATENGLVLADHFSDTTKVIAAGKGAKMSVKDYNLSKRACHLIAQNGDPEKPQISAAQNYFSFTAEFYDMHQARLEQEKRLAIRLKVSESYKQLADAAYQSGVNSETFGIFVDAGYMGLHHHTVEELKERKGIPKREDYLDNITREELSAIDFKNVQTEAKLKRDPVEGLDEASRTHYFIGDQVRRAIEAMHGPMPEDLPPAISIRKMVEERRRKQKKTLRTKTRKDDQTQLFDEPPASP